MFEAQQQYAFGLMCFRDAKVFLYSSHYVESTLTLLNILCFLLMKDQ